MVRSSLPAALLLLLLLLAAGAGWLLLAGGGEEATEPAESIDRTTAGVRPGAVPDPVRLEGDPDAPDEAAGPRVYRQPVPADRLPRGGVVVTVLDAAGNPVPPAGLRVHIESIDRRFWSQPLAVPDPETGRWTFSRVPVGRTAIRVTGDFVREASAAVEVTAGVEAAVAITVQPAGAVSWTAALTNGEVPDSVTLTLLASDGKPVRVGWQLRGPKALGEPRAGTEVVLGAEGVAFGIPPGRYRLRAKSPGEDVEEHEVDVEAGRTASVSLLFRE